MFFKFFLIISFVSFSSGDLNNTKSTHYIVGGKAVNIKDLPYHVAIFAIRNGAYLYGGVIISDKWIVSAAHCFYNRINPTQYSVRAGSSQSEEGGVVYTVKRIILHEKFIGNEQIDYDFCLLETADSIIFNENINPVKIVQENQELSDGTMCFVTGWGATENDPNRKGELRGISVPIFNFQSCIDIYRGMGINITPRMICAGYFFGLKDVCQGDTGSPIVTLDERELIGIVSLYWSCGNPNSPGVYSRISSVRNCIYNNTGI